MRFRPALLAAGLALSGISEAAESSAAGANAPPSPVRQYLRDSLKAPPLAKPVDPAAKPESKSPDAPVVLPAFQVRERAPTKVFEQVNAVLAQRDRRQSHALYKSDRLDILQPPTLERGRLRRPRHPSCE